MTSNRKYKCPFCKLHDTKEKLIHHIDKKHEELIPEGFTAGRVLFHSLHKKPYSEKGKCVVCKGDTEWNEKTYKYNRICNRKECKDKLRESYKNNMLRVHGTYNILNDMDQQEKMLRNRSISGVYRFRNGKLKQYVGSYEKKFLEFCDIMIGFDPDDIIMPGPTIEYEYKGQKHQWITDALIVPYNLVLDVKDGNTRPNNRPMVSYREKQIEKEKVITDKGEYNYLRLTDNQFDQLIGIIYELKLQMLDDPNSDKTISRIHESSQPFLISEKDIEYRIDDFKNHKVPVLWITGQSGGGKSTIANKMADEMNCDLLGIDDIEHFLHMLAEPDKADEVKRVITQDKNYKMIYDRFGKNKQLIEDMTIRRGWSNTEWTNHYRKLFLWLYKMVKMIVPRYTNSNQCIIEGVQIPQLYIEDKSLFKNCAIIVRGTSTVTSLIRRLKRDNPTFGSIKDIPGTLDNIFGYLKMYKDWHKDISDFRNNGPIKESGDDIIRTGKDKEYDEYLKIHKQRLFAAYNDRVEALKNALLLTPEQVLELKHRITVHDSSRYSEEEWDNWRKSYFPSDDKEKEEGKESEKKARSHHYKVNAHHPEHWHGKEMDKVSIAEMIIDWEADSKADGGNPLLWYIGTVDGKDTSKKLNPKTREIVERVLNTIYDMSMNLKDTRDGYNDPKKAEKDN